MKLNPFVKVLHARGRYIIVDGGHADVQIAAGRTPKQEVVSRISETTEKIAEMQRELEFLNQLQREL